MIIPKRLLIIGVMAAIVPTLLPGRTIAMTTMPAQPAPLRPIPQPLALKAGVTLGGLLLMGGNLWWFLGSKRQTLEKGDRPSSRDEV